MAKKPFKKNTPQSSDATAMEENAKATRKTSKKKGKAPKKGC